MCRHFICSICTATLAWCSSAAGSDAPIVGSDALIIRTLIGEPSDSNWSSYFLPLLSVAIQETLDTCCRAKFPICLHVPADNSADGTGSPSTLGLSLDFKRIWSIDSSYKLSCSLLLFSPENVMM